MRLGIENRAPVTSALRKWSRPLLTGALWTLALLLVVVGINLLGIRLLGDTQAWEDWLVRHRFHFLAWRVCLYGATAAGWWRMRKSLLQRERDTAAHARLARTELAAASAIVALEVAVWISPS